MATNASFYSLPDSVEAVKWIPHSPNSSVYALAKLTFVSILPSSLKAALLLDTDVMLTSDIGGLWEYVGDLWRGNKTFGLVENQNEVYLGERREGNEPLPAAGRGYNSGVMLLNLELLRST